MPDGTTSNPEPAITPIAQAPETPIPVVTEPVALIQVEIPTEVAPNPEPIAEPATAQMGGNEPFATAPTENQPNPTEPVIEATPVAQVETPAPAQIPDPVGAQVPASTPTPEPVTQAPSPAQIVATAVAPVVADLNSPHLGASGEASATRIEASPQAPLAENINSQTFTKSIRELFTKAQIAIQNRKRKKIDRVMNLFAKQTTITNNEVEKLLRVSDATATRYLSTLEKEGKIKQNTKKGHATSYSKI